METRNLTVRDQKLVKLLGKGGNASVYLTEDNRACRIMPITSKYSFKYLLKSLDVTNRINHPNILHNDSFYIDKYESGYACFQFFPLAQYDLLKYQKHMADKNSMFVQLFESIGSAIVFLHDSGMYHRDIKPGNILVYQNSVVSFVLADFDLLVYEKWIGGTSGTPNFFSPEMFDPLSKEKRNSEKIDAYAFGMTLLFFLTGKTISDYLWKPIDFKHLRSLYTRELLQGDKSWYNDENIRAALRSSSWNINDQYIDIILPLIRPDPSKRITIREALGSRYIPGVIQQSELKGIEPDCNEEFMGILEKIYTGATLAGDGSSPTNVPFRVKMLAIELLYRSYPFSKIAIPDPYIAIAWNLIGSSVNYTESPLVYQVLESIKGIIYTPNYGDHLDLLGKLTPNELVNFNEYLRPFIYNCEEYFTIDKSYIVEKYIN